MFKSMSMSEDSVRRIRQFSKTQTSRVIVPQPVFHQFHEPKSQWEWKSKFYSGQEMSAKGKYQDGDLVWVREPLVRALEGDSWSSVVGVATYAADEKLAICPHDPMFKDGFIRWRWKRDRLPSIFMPREAVRMFLRVEKSEIADLHRMDYYNILAEGFPDGSYDDFIATWNKLNEKRGYGWIKGPSPPPLWIWRYTFRWENTFGFLFSLVAEARRRTNFGEKEIEKIIKVAMRDDSGRNEKMILQDIIKISNGVIVGLESASKGQS